MRVGLYCFSPTGTGRTVAGRLQAKFPDCRLADITAPARRSATICPRRGELFCLITPVYAHALPTPVARWLNALPTWSGPACIICTYGSAGEGSAARDGARILAQKGATVLGLAELPGPHCYDCAETAYDLRCAPDWEGLESFFTAVLEKAAHGGEPICLSKRYEPVKLIPQSWLGKLAVRYPDVDAGRCNYCNACKAICPVGAIWGKRAKCIRCGACVRNCPVKARRLRFRCVVPALYIYNKIKHKRTPRFMV